MAAQSVVFARVAWAFNLLSMKRTLNPKPWSYGGFNELEQGFKLTGDCKGIVLRTDQTCVVQVLGCLRDLCFELMLEM